MRIRALPGGNRNGGSGERQVHAECVAIAGQRRHVTSDGIGVTTGHRTGEGMGAIGQVTDGGFHQVPHRGSCGSGVNARPLEEIGGQCGQYDGEVRGQDGRCVIGCAILRHWDGQHPCPQRCRQRLRCLPGALVAINADPGTSQQRRRSVGVGQGDEWMKGSRWVAEAT